MHMKVGRKSSALACYTIAVAVAVAIVVAVAAVAYLMDRNCCRAVCLSIALINNCKLL